MSTKTVMISDENSFKIQKSPYNSLQEWVEICRWIKFQETVEPEGNRWSKPHVSTPTLQGWLELRKSLQTGVVLVDIEVTDFPSLCQQIGTFLTTENLVSGKENFF